MAQQGDLFEQEWWRPVVHFPDYEVSSLGRIRRARRSISGNYPEGHILSERYIGGKDRVIGDGGWKYACVDLWRNGERTTMRVHRMVARAFIGPAPIGATQVDHINADRECNRAWNLRWCSNYDNQVYKNGNGNGSSEDDDYEAMERAALQNPDS